MSQRPSASRPASRSPSEGHKITLPPVQVRDDSRHGGRQADRQSEQESRGTQQHHQILPSPQPTRTPQPGLAGDDWRNFGPSRDLGVHSILNPPEGESASASSRPFSGGPTDSPLSTTRQISHFGASPSTTAAHPFSSRQSLPVSTSPSENINPNFARNPHRRMLTPRSPRPVSIGRAPVSGTINAQDSPFLPPRRPYMGETSHTPVSETPPMPTPPPPGQAQAQHYGFPSSGPNTAERRSENPHKQAAGVTQHSTSPSMSTSSQNPSSSQTSPASGYPYYQGGQNPPTSGSYFPGSSFGTPVQQGGGSQLQGPPAASEGASARFRQRRKEKEKEASSNIEKLQQQNRDLERRLRETEGDRDFYRSERNRFRDVLLRNPGMREAAMHAPPSPRTMRPMSYPGPSPQGGPSAMAYQSDTAERPARRRRTDAQGEFTNVPYSHSPASTLPPVQSGFAPSHSQGLPSLPPLRIDNAPTSATTGAPTSSVSAGPTSYEPFSRGPYDRGWPGDGAGRR
ncbi:hypothetical protein ACMFMG_005655 [Clarireedia jacksonii]